MGLLNKLKPFPVDLLLYGFKKSTDLPEPFIKDFPFTIDFSAKESQFIIEHAGKLIHKSRLFTKSLLLKRFGYKQPFVTIGDCVTDDNFRGKGIYPTVIRHIIRKFAATHDVYMLVAPTNIASIQGIKKAGLIPLARLQCLKIGPIYINKTSFQID